MLNKEFIKNNNSRIIIWSLIVIFAIGIFLRTYHFTPWLQFNPDQARDAQIANGVISGKDSLPLLGAIAGGTNFHLGPIFYYFQYFSALIFGNNPTSMAYPDLFFSILAIGLLYVFLQKYFTKNVSLFLTAIMSVSYFAVANSRFAWNPNSIPFFVLLFLYSLLIVINSEKNKAYGWSLLAGLALGVGVQLHTLLLLIMPAIIFIVMAYLGVKNKINWKNLLIIFLVAVFLNLPQIVSEIRSGGENTKNFFTSSSTQSNSSSDMLANVGSMLSCQIEFNFHMISSFENKENCASILAYDKSTLKKANNVPGNFANAYLFQLSILFALIFSIGGYLLLGHYFYQEKNVARKNFLGLLILFNVISLASLVPVASHITMRYFIVFSVVPFVLLGLWVTFIIKMFAKVSKIVLVIVWIVLIVSNIMVVVQAAKPYSDGIVNDGDNSILGETKLMSDFILNSGVNHDDAYLEGEKTYVKRFFPAFEYLLQSSKLTLIKVDNSDDQIKIPADSKIFYIANTGNTKYKIGDAINNCYIGNIQKFNIISMFELINCTK